MKILKSKVLILILVSIFFALKLTAADDLPNAPRNLLVKSYVITYNPLEMSAELSWENGDTPNSVPTESFIVYRKRKKNGKNVEETAGIIDAKGQKYFKLIFTGFKISEDALYSVYPFIMDENNQRAFGNGLSTPWITLSPPSTGSDDDTVKIQIGEVPEIEAGEKVTLPYTVSTNAKCGVIVNAYNVLNSDNYQYEINSSNQTITLWSDKKGAKSLLLYANPSCNSNISSYVKLSGNVAKSKFESPEIAFVDVPKVVKVTKGKEFTMQFKAETDTKCLPTYKVLTTNLPNSSYTFDEAKGIFSFTPSDEPVNPKIEVQAEVECNGLKSVASTTVTFELFIDMDLKDRGNLSGIVVDEKDSNAVITGVANLFPLTKALGGLEKNYKSEIVDGKFVIQNLPAEIEYKLQIIAKGYQSKWYENSNSISEAKILQFNANESKTLTLNLTKNQTRKLFKVSGNCKDSNNAPVKDATIKFYAYGEYFSSNGKKQELENIKTSVLTDVNGKYEIELPENEIFIAQATDLKKANSTKQPQNKYYNNIDSPFESELINVNGDISGVDFKFDYATAAKTATISGQVFDTNFVKLDAQIVAIKIETNNGTTTKGKVYTVKTDTTGLYYFDNLEYGKYILLSIPTDKRYLPGYIKLGGIVTQSWKEATKIFVKEKMGFAAYYAKHLMLPAKQGAGDVSGFVNGKKGIAFKKDNGIEAVETITGAMVYLVNQKGQVVDYSFTEKTGQFAMTQLEDGIYNLVSDAVGFIPSTAQVVINYKTSPSAKSEVTLDMDAVASVEPEVNTSDLVVFPVPANADVTLSFTGLAGKATVNVLSMTGGVVLAQELDVQTGLNTPKFDFSNLSAGSYIVTINNNGRTLARTINIIR